MGFAAAFAASAIVGHAPDIGPTIAAFVLGVGIFIVLFYIQTHHETVQRWGRAMEAQWQKWQAWR